MGLILYPSCRIGMFFVINGLFLISIKDPEGFENKPLGFRPDGSTRRMKTKIQSFFCVYVYIHTI